MAEHRMWRPKGSRGVLLLTSEAKAQGASRLTLWVLWPLGVQTADDILAHTTLGRGWWHSQQDISELRQLPQLLHLRPRFDLVVRHVQRGQLLAAEQAVHGADEVV